MQRKYEERGVEYREDITPAGYIEVDVYDPSYGSGSWDCYGNGHVIEYVKALNAAGIEAIGLVTHRRLLYPTGSGPGGRVRFGDDMLPGTYRVAVKLTDELAALMAIADHKQAITDWLDHKAPMPEACRR